MSSHSTYSFCGIRIKPLSAIGEIQRAYQHHPSADPTFQHLFSLQISDEMELEAQHFLLSKLATAPCLALFRMKQSYYSNFAVCMARVLPRLRHLSLFQSMDLNDFVKHPEFYFDSKYATHITSSSEASLTEERMLEEMVLNYDPELSPCDSRYLGRRAKYLCFKDSLNGRAAFFQYLFEGLSERVEQARLKAWDAGHYDWNTNKRCRPSPSRRKTTQKIV